MLEREEYIEQAYFFRALNERMRQNMATQDLLVALRDEVLSTTKLTMALDFLASELKLSGGFAPAMARLAHYFTAFQTFVIGEAESEQGRFDFRVALEILERDSRYRAEGASPQGMFLFQFESLCRNRLGYDRGLEAISRDPMFDQAWKEWILTVRRQVGLVDFADLIYVRSQHYVNQRRRQQLDLDGPEKPVLFGEKEGKIAFANRQKDPLWLFAALERHLNYPTVPKPQPVDEAKNLLPGMIRRLERVETRLKLLEEEQKGGIDLARFYQPPAGE
ncbi:MAG TPA: hypothetical protein VG433_16280 [Pirellulales bacterium]|jgi:hypothetical protein|nr:hypothetical protein [Pirellulales bacterium]